MKAKKKLEHESFLEKLKSKSLWNKILEPG